LQRFIVSLVVVISALGGCQSVPPPIDDYNLARTAIDAARMAQAPRLSSGYWHQADEAYKQAKISFENRDFAKAKQLFLRARTAAEKAENSARLIRQRTGDVL
jgi:hypothetical protein